MNFQQIVLVVHFAMCALVIAYGVGRPREPLTGRDALIWIPAYAALIVLVVTAA